MGVALTKQKIAYCFLSLAFQDDLVFVYLVGACDLKFTQHTLDSKPFSVDDRCKNLYNTPNKFQRDSFFTLK